MELWQMGEPHRTVPTFGPEVVDFIDPVVRPGVEPAASTGRADP
jgi:hypothetical protein